ncbi:sn-glycerol-3-phosphate ABC transporter ATP-binding protein UgpC [Yinghuangia sp. ASG 101]|uniref:ABC transporter ATP-binding protein n=1 Tax=Yinghuangia sp. ASG 101 TaxID=2896848 RepID=UPI001E626256|nr:sn-glycerol-3-phosphate ABC transporter ATP-binding protein UgpC [Yinghuangia sp. ASG 101]UGQ14884.1 sn-glycerol-3-phosphate ABC transporter ATP-binding protein UgpC [Yinghuangia sp. ASG 101]
MASVTFHHASCTYKDAERPSVDALDLEVADGEFLVLVGPSGCGKTTSLRMVAGLEEVTGGSISIGDRDVTFLEPKERDIAMVFQNYGLYPNMTVAQNMGFALKIAGAAKDVIRAKVEETARMLDLDAYLDRKPKALSGGQRQRVAMGRAIVREPRVFLMDEPLSNLDAKLRVQTRTQIASLQRRLGITTVYVTHDQVEAMTMGDRVAVLRDGVLQQVDAPRTMYDRPANVFVAGFIGSPAMNLVATELTADGVRFGDGVLPVAREARERATAEGTTEVTLGIRPEHLDVRAPDALADHGTTLPVVVDVVEELGADAYIYGTARVGSEPAPVVVRVPGRTAPGKGETVHVVARPDETHLFSTRTGARLSD